MKTVLSAALIFVLTTAAAAQFANNPALTKKPPADAEKPADNAPGVPPKVNEPAPGQPVGGPNAASAIFAALDVDGDGTISKAELRKAVVSLRKLDADNDGALTLAECGGGAAGGGAAIAGNDANQWVDQIMLKDKNRDGRLTADELNVGETQMLQGADLNGDGAIDRQELAQIGKGQGGVPGGPGSNFAGGANGGQGVGRRGNNEAMGRFFQYDRNRDGRLTADEVPPQAMGALQGGDRNGDGAIDAGEMQAIVAQMGDRAKAFGAGADPNAAGKDGNNRRRPPRTDKNDKNDK
jgi:Ca2+-binding EF-hand superfamily protein